MTTGLESVLVFVACEKNLSLIRLLCPRWDPEGNLVEREMRMWDHIFVVFYVLGYSVVIAELFATLTSLLVPMVVICCVLIVVVVLYHAARLRSLAALATAAGDAGGAVEGRTDVTKEGGLLAMEMLPNGMLV